MLRKSMLRFVTGYTTMFLCAVGCNSSSDTDEVGGGESSSEESWPVGYWFHEEGINNNADYDDYTIDLSSDGTGVRVVGAGGPISVTWSASDSSLMIDGVSASVSANCRTLGYQGLAYWRDSAGSDCPTQPNVLTSFERCAVGTFDLSDDDTKFTIELSADRFLKEDWDRNGPQRTMYQKVGVWSVTANGDVEVEYPQGGSEIRSTMKTLAGAARIGAMDPGCDVAQWDSLTTGNLCDNANVLDGGTWCLIDSMTLSPNYRLDCTEGSCECTKDGSVIATLADDGAACALTRRDSELWHSCCGH